ncbi:MAG: lysostaphin resistance A-like protein [Rudaea sp.]
MAASLADRTFENQSLGEHTLARTLVLYLVPGALITAVFVIFAALARRQGAPASLALLLTWPVAGLPLLLGILLYEGRRRNGRLSLAGVVRYRQPLAMRDYLWLIPALLVWAALASTLSVPLAEATRRALFPWWPDWLLLSTFAENLRAYSALTVWLVVGLSFGLNIAVPIVEEMYFRGYLLPQLERWGSWAPLVNVVLFSLYHFWLPWENLTRIITLLPIVYAVYWKRNIYLSILVHCLLNTLGSIGLLVLVLTAR